jgi:hypothetical protein
MGLRRLVADAIRIVGTPGPAFPFHGWVQAWPDDKQFSPPHYAWKEKVNQTSDRQQSGQGWVYRLLRSLWASRKMFGVTSKKICNDGYASPTNSQPGIGRNQGPRTRRDAIPEGDVFLPAFIAGPPQSENI